MTMDKLGVDENREQNEELEKIAMEGCPVHNCRRTPDRHGNVLSCPIHGTEPFEEQRKRE
jgi:hypothetical protein